MNKHATSQAPKPRNLAPWSDLSTALAEASQPQDDDRQRAAGIPRAQLRKLTISLTRQQFLKLVNFLEERARRSDRYDEIHAAVLFAEILKAQARPQLY